MSLQTPLQTTPHLPYICARCLRSASSVLSKSALNTRTHASVRPYSTSTSILPPPPPPSGHTRLNHRRLLLLHGPDTTHFLHGITTASIQHGLTSGFYSTFLTAQGRILHDVFIYPCSHSSTYTSRLPPASSTSTSYTKWQASDPAFFIEVDATQTAALLKHLRRYKLRAKFEMRAVNEGEWDVYSYWEGEERWTAHSSSIPNSEDLNGRIGARDARAPGMGHRLVLPGSINTKPDSSADILSQTPEAPLSSYHIRRILRGVPENQSTGEIPSGSTLPHEMNIDLMSGIDFKKGCYVGQELTIRTQHTGIVRKRVLPVMLYASGAAPPTQLEYTSKSESNNGSTPEVVRGRNILPLDTNAASKTRPRPAGKILTSVGNIGLGLCRIEKMTDVVLTAEGSGWSQDEEFYLPAREEDRDEGKEMDKHEGGVRIKAFVPDWIRNQIKVREPQRRVE